MDLVQLWDITSAAMYSFPKIYSPSPIFCIFTIKGSLYLLNFLLGRYMVSITPEVGRPQQAGIIYSVENSLVLAFVDFWAIPSTNRGYCLTDWEHGPPPKIIVSDFNFFSKLGKIGLKKMLGGVGFPHWTFFSPGASFSQWTFQ